jgi:nucleotide-binding universal stress UspA family protein
MPIMARRTIVVPVDESPSAQAALELALKLARSEESDVLVLHSSPAIAQRLFDENPLTRDEEREIEADAVLRAAVAQARAGGVSVHAEVIGEHGSTEVADAIIGIAQARDADLIVMGSRGRGPVSSSLLGSVSRAVVTGASMPVVVVHTPRTND